MSLSALTINNGIQNAALPAITLDLAPGWYLIQTSVVGNALNIIPGNIVKFTSTADTTKWMIGTVDSYDPATGILVFTVATVAIELEIRRVERNGSMFRDSGYGANYALGSYDCAQPILTASVGNGITIVDLGIFQIYFSETQFRQLSSGVHSVAATLASADGVDVRQLFLGRLPVLSGMVTN